jgi:esterase/lipase superfamily enzyme
MSPTVVARILAVALLCLGVGTPTARAQSEAWVLMATQSVDLTAGRVVIDVSKAPGEFKALRLQAKSAFVVSKVMITYGAGPAHIEERGVRIETGIPTAALGASQSGRFVSAVELTLPAVANGAARSTILEVFGLQTPDGARARRPAPQAVAEVPAASKPVPRDVSPPVGGTRGGGLALPVPPPAPVVGAAPPPPPAPAPSAPVATSRGVTPSPPVAPSPPPPGAAAEAAKPPATDKKSYATVPVLFGTDRKQEADRKAKWGETVATYGADSQFKLGLGKAIVTVPTKEGVRARGSVPRPELDIFGFRVKWGEEQLDQHFTVYSAASLDEAGFLAEVKKSLGLTKRKEKHAFLFVHGYNVTFEDSLYRTAQIAHDLEFDGAAFMYSWPSKGDPRAYLYDEDRAKGARPYLRQMLEMIAAKTEVEHLHIVAHSKGAELMVEVLSALSTVADARKTLRINEIILAAPDIDRANFEQIADRIVGVAQRGVTLYASNNDKALGLSKSIRLGTDRAGEVPKDKGPVMVKGLDTIDISAASTDFFGSNHTLFAERLPLISDMGSILRDGMHPPDQRDKKIFTPVTSGLGRYWRYVK